MKRLEVSNDELERIIKFRQTGTSWLKIEREINIPRRTAKRAHDTWQSNQSLEELKAARKEVAAEEFRRHLNSLIMLAEALVNHLSIPLPTMTINAEEHLNRLWEKDIIVERETEGFGKSREKREIDRTIHRNEMLFRSLQAHTHEKGLRQVLNTWEQAWDGCIYDVSELRKEAHSVIKNILGQEEGFLRSIKIGNGEKDSIARISDMVLEVVWQKILDGNLGSDRTTVHTVPITDGTTQFTSVGYGGKGFIRFIDNRLAEKTAENCNWAVTNLCKGDKQDIAARLGDRVTIMNRAIKQLGEILNPLMLRPMILRTRCDLCPA